jgi:hypothetical protein
MNEVQLPGRAALTRFGFCQLAEAAANRQDRTIFCFWEIPQFLASKRRTPNVEVALKQIAVDQLTHLGTERNWRASDHGREHSASPSAPSGIKALIFADTQCDRNFVQVF